MVQIRYADRPGPRPDGMLVRVLRGFIFVGVWTLVGLAGVAAWIRLSA